MSFKFGINKVKKVLFNSQKVSAIINGSDGRLVFWNPTVSFKITSYNYKWWDTGVDATMTARVTPIPPSEVQIRAHCIEMNMNRQWANYSARDIAFDSSSKVEDGTWVFSFSGSRVNLGLFFIFQYKDSSGNWINFSEEEGNYAFGYTGDNGKGTSVTTEYKGSIGKEIYDERNGFGNYSYDARIFIEKEGNPSH